MTVKPRRRTVRIYGRCLRRFAAAGVSALATIIRAGAGNFGMIGTADCVETSGFASSVFYPFTFDISAVIRADGSLVEGVEFE